MTGPDLPHRQKDELFAALAQLPACDVDQLTAERIRRAAHRALAGRLSRSRRIYRAVESACVLAVAAASLIWVFQKVIVFYQ